METNVCITRFQQYLQIRTDHPNPDYDGAIAFLSAVVEDFGLPYMKFVFVPEKPILLVTVEGQDPTLPSIFLSSHMDVVPAFFENWKFDPFGGHIDEDGKIYGRGTQDMKSIGLQYLEAMNRLKRMNISMKRSVHICFVPDEEVGSTEGMGRFVETEEFRLLNVGLCLDEGVASEDDIYRIYYAERSLWWLKIIASGNSGHASAFIEDTAAEKLYYVVGKFLEMNREEKAKLLNDHCLTVGDATSANLTMLSGGVHQNVVPSELAAYFDIRFPLTANFDALRCKFEQWLREAGVNIRFEFIHKEENTSKSPHSKDNIWWRTITNAFEQLGFKYRSEVFLGGTDARYLRCKGYNAYGFSPIICTPLLFHDHNEYIECDTYLKGISIYAHLISSLANVD
uniref:N-acyl-aliphatic-L-amino acid amidohydrolase n=1 Tax=Trichuris muris TaxID=70415 RepID=A0A5S6R179_TRIMR